MSQRFPFRDNAPDAARIVTGHVTRSPNGESDPIWVRLNPSFGIGRQEWGPCPWHPRYTLHTVNAAQTVVIPPVGAFVLAVFTERQMPWVLDYWTYGGLD